jgi:hypothetical protein
MPTIAEKLVLLSVLSSISGGGGSSGRETL